MTNYIRTFTGRKLHVPRPEPGDICIEDIAHGLACMPRWGGHTFKHYPVAAHAIFVAMLVPDEFKFDALNHDDSEAYLADIPAPIKYLMPDYKRIEGEMMRAIADTLGFQWPPSPAVKYADAVALYAERCALFPEFNAEDVPVATHPQLESLLRCWDFDDWCNWSEVEVASQFTSFFNECKALKR